MGNTRKFTQHIKNSKQLLKQQLNNITESNKLNSFSVTLIETNQQAADSAYRLKTSSRTTTFSYWTTELKIKLNQLTALRRKRKRLRDNENDDETYNSLSKKYSKISVIYKRSLLYAKIKTWRQFCSNTTYPLGITQKLYTGKLFTLDEIMLEESPSVTSRQQNLQFMKAKCMYYESEMHII